MGDKSTEFITEFIDIYRQHPALWKVKSKTYTNKRLKEDGYSKLLQHYKTVNESATVDTVKRKINNLRCAFRKELKKVKKRKSGSSQDEVYKSSLWYYELISFTADQEEMRETKGNDEDDNDEHESNEAEIKNDYQEENHETNSYGNDESDSNPETLQLSIRDAHRRVSTKKSELPTSKKRTIQEITLQKACEALNEKQDEFDITGSNIAFKLRKMNSEQALFAENLINNILFSGLQGKLNTASTLCNNNCDSYIQQQGNYCINPTSSSFVSLGTTSSTPSAKSAYALSNFLLQEQ